MDDFDSLGESVALLIVTLIIVAIYCQVQWLIKKEVYGTTDCFWKECVIVKGEGGE